MTPECIHCLLYILMASFGFVVSNHQFHEERNTIEENYLAKTPYLPSFLTTPGNITVNKGDEAILPCAVEHRGTRTVAWRKLPTPSPITIGIKRYVKDDRFRVVHPTHSLEWNLHIKNAQPEDSAEYECQVAAVARSLRQRMVLRVRDMPSGKRRKQVRPSISSSSSREPTSPRINIRGSFFVERGDTLKLQCHATGSEYIPEEIDWFKDGNKIKNSDRIFLEIHVSMADRTITSALHIKRGRMEDAGTYVCRTSDLQVTSVKVNVLNTKSNNEKRAKSSDGKRVMPKNENKGFYDNPKRSSDETDPGSGADKPVSSQGCLIAVVLSLLFILMSPRSL